MESDVQIQPESEASFEMDHVEYLDEDIENLIQQDEYRTINLNANNNNTQIYDNKENTPIDIPNLDENSNNSFAATPTIKRKKRKSKSKKDEKAAEKVESTLQPTQILADVAKKSYEMQNLYYENKIQLKKQELELKGRLVNAVENCNTF